MNPNPALATASPEGHASAAPSWLVPGWDRMGGGASLLVPLAALLAAQGLITALSAPVLARAAPGAAAAAPGALWIMAFVMTAGLLLRTLAAGAAAWSLLVLAGRPVAFLAGVSVLLYGGLILAAQDLFLLTLLGTGVVEISGGALPSMGLDVLLSDAPGWLTGVASVITPFRLAWAAFVAVGFTAVARGRWYHGAGVALVLLAAAATVAALGRLSL